MAYIMKPVTRRLPDGLMRTYYMRLAGMGDGPITSPDQDPATGAVVSPPAYDEPEMPPSSTFDSSSNDVVATVGPVITGVTGAVTSTVDWLANALTGGSGSTSTGAPVTSSTPTVAPQPNLLVIAAIALGGYAAYKHFAKQPKRRATVR